MLAIVAAAAALAIVALATTSPFPHGPRLGVEVTIVTAPTSHGRGWISTTSSRRSLIRSTGVFEVHPVDGRPQADDSRVDGLVARRVIVGNDTPTGASIRVWPLAAGTRDDAEHAAGLATESSVCLGFPRNRGGLLIADGASHSPAP